MTQTPEQARIEANRLLAALYTTVTDWDTALLDQVLLAIASDGQPFSMNDVRLVVPEDACKRAGLYFHSLVNLTHPQVLEPIGDVRSINKKAHGKKVNTYRLTADGRKYIEERRAARAGQSKAAA
ncbi:hypothetical protein [Streptomyces europaeiscabiei]|uniref:hypothetical protein n=1 Tax=Streptomyces europaeiscabiei TaxID=146819 RepID=UPI0029B9DB82|nr:hypothetical protein [Streptomyces europaeiscabiei]MDX2761608.1 hypothetical protein [Streptomyces europaeiscabiei]